MNKHLHKRLIQGILLFILPLSLVFAANDAQRFVLDIFLWSPLFADGNSDGDHPL